MTRPVRQVALPALVLCLASMGVAFAQPGPHLDPLARVLDTDGDGVLVESEIDGAASGLRALDADQDGRITSDEMPEHGPGREGGRRPPGDEGPGVFDNPVMGKDQRETKILAAFEEIRKGPGFANVPPQDGRLLRLLTEAVGAQRVVEIGTSTGDSAVWLALALGTTGGKLLTHEIDPERARIARANFEKAGVADLVTVIEGDAHETVKQHREPIDVLFLDADKEGYIDYLDRLLPLVRPGGLVIAHNMNPQMADPSYVKAITTNPALETAFLYMEHGGVSVTLKKR
jgi:caffeoyl-CoA O-methyltransferase